MSVSPHKFVNKRKFELVDTLKTPKNRQIERFSDQLTKPLRFGYSGLFGFWPKPTKVTDCSPLL